MLQALTTAMLTTCPSIGGRFSDHRTRPVLREILGVKNYDPAALMKRATAARMTALALAPVLACGEMDSTKEAWRTDGVEGTGSNRRTKTRAHLTLLQLLGYDPTPIERAVLQNKPYNPKS